MSKIKEEVVAQAWVAAGISPDAAKAQLISTGNYVSIEGKTTKVYGAKVLAIMHQLLSTPVLPDDQFAV